MGEDPVDETPDERTQRVLREHGLPEGLLPAGLTRARIEADGTFEVELPARVERMRGAYRIRYERHVSGVLAAGRVRRLRGVKVHQLVWFDVDRIEAEGDDLVFTVGPVRRALPASLFAPAPGMEAP